MSRLWTPDSPSALTWDWWAVRLPNVPALRDAWWGMGTFASYKTSWDSKGTMSRDDAAELLKRAAMTITRIANPAGVIIATVSSAPIEGYLLCDGAGYERTAYPLLYDALPEQFRVTDDEFETPYLLDTYLMGTISASGLGDSVGANKRTLTENEMPAHAHGYEGVIVNNIALPVGGGAPLPVSQVVSISSSTGSRGAGQPFDIKPQSVKVRFWISHGQG